MSQEKKHHVSDEYFVAEFLVNHPEFFIEQPQLLEHIRIPHSELGTVSLIERQQQLLRQQLKQKEEQLTQLIRNAARNEQIFKFNCQLIPQLFACADLDALKQLLSLALQQEYGFSHVILLPVHDLEPALLQLISKRLPEKDYFGRLTSQEAQLLFGCEVGSVALTHLQLPQQQYLLAIASHEPGHFFPDMDALLHQHLMQMITHQLMQF